MNTAMSSVRRFLFVKELADNMSLNRFYVDLQEMSGGGRGGRGGGSIECEGRQTQRERERDKLITVGEWERLALINLDEGVTPRIQTADYDGTTVSCLWLEQSQIGRILPTTSGWNHSGS